MKSLLLLGLVAFSAQAFASEKIDFNHLIRENNKDKKELVNKLYDQVHDTQFNEAVTTQKTEVIADETPGETLIVPTATFKTSNVRKSRSASAQVKTKNQIESEIMDNEIKN